MQEMMSFPEAVVTCFRKYVVSRGRGSRAEYWWFVLFSSIVLTAVNIIASLFFSLETAANIVGLVNFFFFFPGLFASVRRLHDLGRSGWWVLVGFFLLPILLIFFCFPSQKRENAYGSIPCCTGTVFSFEKTGEEK